MTRTLILIGGILLAVIGLDIRYHQREVEEQKLSFDKTTDSTTLALGLRHSDTLYVNADSTMTIVQTHFDGQISFLYIESDMNKKKSRVTIFQEKEHDNVIVESVKKK